jgi:putative ABC transport system permease protein
MVYNGARISLSERGHELASLRVLGFTQGEIAVMLLGEQAFLMLVSLPLGFALGYGICYGLTFAMQTELYRMPLVLTPKTYVIAFSVVAIASLFTGILIFRRLRRMDLIGVLKTRE